LPRVFETLSIASSIFSLSLKDGKMTETVSKLDEIIMELEMFLNF